MCRIAFRNQKTLRLLAMACATQTCSNSDLSCTLKAYLGLGSFELVCFADLFFRPSSLSQGFQAGYSGSPHERGLGFDGGTLLSPKP